MWATRGVDTADRGDVQPESVRTRPADSSASSACSSRTD